MASINHFATNSGAQRGLNNRKSNEPLKRFTDAKKDMASIYNDLGNHVNSLGNFYEGFLFPYYFL